MLAQNGEGVCKGFPGVKRDDDAFGVGENNKRGFATQDSFRVGSYTGRLRFDPAQLRFRSENPISDGMRVANANGAAQGLIRFAGASPSGLTTLVLYDGSFEVRAAGFAPTLRLQMEELSAALTLMNLAPRLTVNRQVFQYRAAEPRP